MATTFEAGGIPILPSVDGSVLQNKERMLNRIKEDGDHLVFKEDFGGSGQGMIKATSLEEAEAAFHAYEQTGHPFLVQPYINLKTPDNRSIDYRAIVVGNKVLGGLKRTTQPGEWRTNNYLGSQNTPHTFTPQQTADAVKALQAADLGFGSVDIAIDPQTGQHFIFEINDGMDMGHLSKANPEIDLPGTIIQMREERYGEKHVTTLCQQDFSNTKHSAAPPAQKAEKPITLQL